MRKIDCWNDMREYGFDCLTGEACGLSYRLLVDVTDKGRRIFAKAMGQPRAMTLAENWNHGSNDDPHVGSIMLAREMLAPIAVFALLEEGCVEVQLFSNGEIIGVELSDDRELVENRIGWYANNGTNLLRRLSYGGTARDRNVHEMSRESLVNDEELAQKLRDSTFALCPFCGTDHITRTDIDGGGSTVTLTWHCEDCHKEWYETYLFVGATQPEAQKENP